MGKVTRVSRSLYEFTNNDDCVRFVWRLKKDMEKTGGMTLSVIDSTARILFGRDYESRFDGDDWRDHTKIVHEEDLKYKKWGESYSTLNLGTEQEDKTTVDDFKAGLRGAIRDFYKEFTNNHPHLREEIANITILNEVYEGEVANVFIYREVE